MKSQRFVKALVKKKQLLVAMSLLHTVLGFIVVASILSFSFDINLPYVDVIASLVPISFVIFRRCIYTDACGYIKGDSEVPDYCSDGFYFNELQKLLFGKEIISKPHMDKYKGETVTNVSYFCDLEDESIIRDIFNEKIHYITINCIFIVSLLTKYNQKKLIPLFLGWFIYVFSN